MKGRSFEIFKFFFQPASGTSSLTIADCTNREVALAPGTSTTLHLPSTKDSSTEAIIAHELLRRASCEECRAHSLAVVVALAYMSQLLVVLGMSQLLVALGMSQLLVGLE